MSAPRIADRDLAPERAGSDLGTRTTGTGEPLGTRLASPVAILLIVPGLVAAVGLFLTVLGQAALRESTTQLGRDRLVEQTEFIARNIAASLGQADPMLDRLAELAVDWTPEDPLGPMAHALRGAMRGRAGIAYASISFPDGTFRGAYREPDGQIRFKEARARADGVRVMTEYDFAGKDQVVFRAAKESEYDPRKRDFYRLAVAHRGRVWTAPYPFFSSHQTGVTRADALFEPATGQLRAVLTADFDVHALSGSMAHTPVTGARTLLYARDATLLAYPEGAAALARLPLRTDRPISFRDLTDPVIAAFFRQGTAEQPTPWVATSSTAPASLSRFVAGREPSLATVVAVPGFPELGWTVASIVPESEFFRARERHQRQSMLVAAGSLLAALAIAVVFARHVVRVRRDAASARDLARKASDRARELGSYRLVERLGEGGMGEVWRAEHRLLVRQAAIKLIRQQALASPRRPPAVLRERFRREAQTLATLRSRHTIEIFDYGVTDDGTFYYVMELLDGVDLDTLVERDGPQPAGRVIQLLLQACSSLAEAHAAGLVHRDVKPANLFVCRAADEVDIVKVLDFGIAHAAAHPDSEREDNPTLDEAGSGPRLTRLGQRMGTPAVMAPEQVRGEVTDGRADLYALGCVAVWLLTGRMPFEAATSMATMGAHLYTPVPDLAALVPGHYPPELDRILRQCLEKDRALRPADAATLAAALRAVPLPREEVWTSERARRWWTERLPTLAASRDATAA